MTPSEGNGGLVERKVVLDVVGIENTLESLSRELIEAHPQNTDILVVGIHTGGAHLASRLASLLAKKGVPVELGMIDITLYRDDVFVGLPRPEVGPTQLPSSIAGKTIILVDDVLFTGRTVRSALDELIDYGRPHCVQLAVLIDRGHRELPIQADFVGVSIETTRRHSVRVHLTESGSPEDRVILYETEDRS